jgi:hypothetical protein
VNSVELEKAKALVDQFKQKTQQRLENDRLAQAQQLEMFLASP